MALITCKECGHQISSNAKTCPSCGAKPVKPVGMLGIITALIIGAIVFKCASPAHEPPPAPTPKSAAELAAEKIEAEATRKRHAATADTLAYIISHARNPSSVTVELAGASEDGSVVCIQYRAQNGFGGMNRETISQANGKISDNPKQWNKHCLGGNLIDMMDGIKH